MRFGTGIRLHLGRLQKKFYMNWSESLVISTTKNRPLKWALFVTNKTINVFYSTIYPCLFQVTMFQQMAQLYHLIYTVLSCHKSTTDKFLKVSKASFNEGKMIDIRCVGNSLSHWFMTSPVEFSTGEFRAKQVLYEMSFQMA